MLSLFCPSPRTCSARGPGRISANPATCGAS
ncbi:hypothetical protein CTA1_8142, partial [Colletotrichum tanaceti]